MSGGSLSIHDFMTDGSLPALCDQLTLTTRTPVWLRDGRGMAIIATDNPEHPWHVVEEAHAAERAANMARVPYEPQAEVYEAPIVTSEGLLGTIVMRVLWAKSGAKPTFTTAETRIITLDPPPHDAGSRHNIYAHTADAHTVAPHTIDTPANPGAAQQVSRTSVRTLQRVTSLVARAISETCQTQVSLRKRLRELDALYRLSSLLVQAGNADELLTVALDLAMNVLQADAGSIAVIDDASGGLSVKASRNLSNEWVFNPAPLSFSGVLRRTALEGEIVTVDDLLTDPRVQDHARAETEGLRSLISAGMLYEGRPIGLLRLYTRNVKRFTESHKGLLRAIAEQSAAAIHSAQIRRDREEDARIQRQVKLAADVQRRMLPTDVPNIPRLDFAARYEPSFELGGDFYDFIELGQSIGVAVADVSGKGVAAALLMSAVRASLRAHAQDVYDLSDVLLRVNRALVRDTIDADFATLWYGVIDPVTLTLTYCSGGHDWPLMIRVPRDRPVTEDDVVRLTASGMAMGIDPAQTYEKGTHRLRPRDVLLVFTDGLADTLNFNGDRFGGKRLRRAVIDLLTAEPEATAARITEHVFWSVRQFAGLSRRTDDMTLVVLRVRD